MDIKEAFLNAGHKGIANKGGHKGNKNIAAKQYKDSKGQRDSKKNLKQLGYKYRLYPSKGQMKLFDFYIYASKLAYNKALCLIEKRDEENKKLPITKRNYKNIAYDSIKDTIITKLKATDMFKKYFTDDEIMGCLKEIVQNTLTHINQAEYNRYERNQKNKNTNITHKLREKDISSEGGSFLLLNEEVRVDKYFYAKKEDKDKSRRPAIKEITKKRDKHSKLELFGYKIDVIYHRNLPQEHSLRHINISKDNTNCYHISLNITYEDKTPIKKAPKEIVALDLNTNNIASTDNGKKAKESKFPKETLTKSDIRFRGKYKEMQRLNSKLYDDYLNEGTPLSKAYYKREIALNKVDKKRANILKHHYYKEVKTFTDLYNSVVIEDLSVEDMMKKKGEKNSRHMRRKSQRASYGKFMRILRYKARSKGRNVIVVDKFLTSKMCSKCGFASAKDHHQRGFLCKECGYKNSVDKNASINVYKRGKMFIENMKEYEKYIQNLKDEYKKTKKITKR